MANYKISVIIDEKGATRAAGELRKLDSELNKVGKSGAGGGAFASIGGLGGIAQIAAVGVAIDKLTDLAIAGGTAVFEFSKKMENTRIGFETLMGGAVEANKHLEDLRKFATETPFEFESLTSASRRLQNVGLEAAKIIPLMRSIGNAAAAAGASSEELDSITLAFSQIVAKGKLSAEEVNQLAERGIPVWQMLSKTLGKTKGEIIDLAEKGKISSDLFLEVFQQFSDQRFGDAMLRQSKTFAGAWSTIKDTALMEGERTFAPLYTELSQIASKSADEITKQKADLGEIGVIIAENIVEGAVRGLRNADLSGALDDFVKRTQAEAESKGFGATILKLAGGAGGQAIAGGIEKGFKDLDPYAAFEINGLLNRLDPDTNTIAQFPRFVRQGNAELDQLTNTVRTLGREINRTPSLTESLETEDAAKEIKTLNSIVSDLVSQLTLWGNESDEAALRQRLLREGITDFDSALARNALNMARKLDQLKDAKKAQDEYNSALENANEYLENLGQTARFDSMFPNPTELDRFEEWVKRQGSNFKELASQISATRAALQAAATVATVNRLNDLNAAELSRMATVIEGELNPAAARLDTELRNVATNLGLSGSRDQFGVDVTASYFSQQVQGYIEAIEQWKAAMSGQSVEQVQRGLDQIQTSFREFLTSFRTKDGLPIIGDKSEAGQWISYFLRLGDAMRQSQAAEQVKEFNRALDGFGIRLAGAGAKNQVEQFTEWLADPATTQQIEARAKALGMTADELRRIIETQFNQGTRRRRVGEEESGPGGFAGGLFGEIGIQKIETEAERAAAAYTQLGAIAGSAINSLAQGMGQLIENWVLYGNTSGMSAKKAIASALAMAAAQSGVSAIMETAYGIAALTPWGAAIYGPAAFHFKSAALFASIALGTALAGRALAGNSFSGSGSQAGGPDYQTATSPPVSGIRDNNQFSGGAGRAQAETNSRLAAAVEGLQQKIGSMRPGEVLTTGAREARGFISETVTRELRSNGSKATEMGRALRLA